MNRSIFAIFICCCVLGLTSRSYALCDRLPNPYVNSKGTWTVQGNGCYATADDASAACEFHELSAIPCEYEPAGGFGLDTAFYITYAPSTQKIFGIYWIDPGGIGDCSAERAAAESECGGADLYVIDEQTCDWYCDDSDGDGIPDGQDPCPQNPNPDCTDPNDGDGDGIPDGQDPCPQNPNPNCTDPDHPPPETPEIPGEIIVGDCTFDLTSFKEWLNTDSSFPFNLMFRLVALITPLFDLTPAPPVFDISIDASAISGRFSYIPSVIAFSWDFTTYDIYAKILRAVEILSIVIAVVSYGLNSNKERP